MKINPDRVRRHLRALALSVSVSVLGLAFWSLIAWAVYGSSRVWQIVERQAGAGLIVTAVIFYPIFLLLPKRCAKPGPAPSAANAP